MDQLQIALGDSKRSATLDVLMRKATNQVKGCDYRLANTINISGFLEQVIMLSDGRVAYCYDNIIRLWNPSDDDFLTHCETIELSSPVFQIHQHKATGYLLGISGESLFVWDLDRGSSIFTFSALGDVTEICDLSDGCRIAAVIANDDEIAILNLKTFENEQSIHSGRGGCAMTVLTDGRLVTASSIGTFIWDVCASGIQKTEIKTINAGWLYALLPLPDGKLIFGNCTGFLQILDLSSLTCLLEIKADDSKVGHLILLPQNEENDKPGDDHFTVISIGLLSRTVQTWQYSLSSGFVKVNPSTSVLGNLAIKSLHLKNGKIALWSVGDSVRILNPHTNEIVNILPDTAKGLLELSDGRLITYRTDKNTINIWEPYFAP